jgi:hypothetical protein
MLCGRWTAIKLQPSRQRDCCYAPRDHARGSEDLARDRAAVRRLRLRPKLGVLLPRGATEQHPQVAAGDVAGTTAVVKGSWLDTAHKAAANHVDFDGIDPKLWNLAALAESLGVLHEMTVSLRLTFTLLKRLPRQHQQLVASVPLRLIFGSPLLPTRVIADHVAADALVFLQAALTHAAERQGDTTALASIGKLTAEDASSIVVGALRNGGLKCSLTTSLAVMRLDAPLAVLTPHRNNQLKLLASRPRRDSCRILPSRSRWSPARSLSLRRVAAPALTRAPGSQCSPRCSSSWA